MRSASYGACGAARSALSRLVVAATPPLCSLSQRRRSSAFSSQTASCCLHQTDGAALPPLASPYALRAHASTRAPTPTSVTGASSLCLLSVPRGLARAEALSTLLHEAMHGLFYTSEPFAAAARAFFQALSQQHRSLWRSFLTTLGYDSANEELVVNEFQAYMSTERELFGAAGVAQGGHTPRRGRGAASAEVVQALTEIQRQWASAMGKHVPLPVPRVAGCACVFTDCGDGGSPGPFRLKGHKQ